MVPMKWFIIVFCILVIIVGLIFWELWDIIQSFQSKLESERRHRREDVADLRIKLNALRHHVMGIEKDPPDEFKMVKPFMAVPQKSDVANIPEENKNAKIHAEYKGMVDSYLGENPLLCDGGVSLGDGSGKEES